MSFICIDGISGIGKSTLIEHVGAHAENAGLKVRKMHFFSDLPIRAGYDSEVIRRVEQATLDSSTFVDDRYSAFRELCRVACIGFLRLQDQWSEEVVSFDRSPLSYLVYCASDGNQV